MSDLIARASKATSAWNALEPIQQTSLVDRVASQLVDLTFNGTYRPGDRLPPEQELAKHLGVSRSTVREALIGLRLLGLIEMRQGEGTFVRRALVALPLGTANWTVSIGPDTANALIEARLVIEPALASFAATRATPEQLSEIELAFRRMNDAGNDLERFAEADLDFHTLIASAGANQLLETFFLNIRSMLREWIRRVVASRLATAEQLAVVLHDHQLILQGLANQDSDEAHDAMHEHLLRVALDLRRVIKEGSPPIET